MKKTTIFIAVIMLFLKSSLAAMAFDDKIRLSVFPFNNVKLQALDNHIQSVLNSELLKHSFIEAVPVEVIRQKVFDIEPSLMWTGEEGGVSEGGIYWKINSKMIETAHKSDFADYYIYGDYLESGNEWRVVVHISENTASRPDETFIINGTTDEDVEVKLKALAKKIYQWLNNGHVINQAENIIREYMGNLFGYDTALRKMALLVKVNPHLIPPRALLLDLYIRDKTNNSKAVSEGLNIINIYHQLQDDDVRYILSLSIDPFDVVARSYEAERKWSEAINIRLKALELFPLNMQAHKKRLGEAYYFRALMSSNTGMTEQVRVDFSNALEYLNPSSEYYGPASRGSRKGESQ